MFWTAWGDNPKIERANLGGGQRLAIITTNLYYPNGLDLDKGNQRIFWVDAALDRVESIDYNGGNRKLIFQLSGLHPFGVALAPPFLFFTDWNTKREVHKRPYWRGVAQLQYQWWTAYGGRNIRRLPATFRYKKYLRIPNFCIREFNPDTHTQEDSICANSLRDAV